MENDDETAETESMIPTLDDPLSVAFFLGEDLLYLTKPADLRTVPGSLRPLGPIA